MNDSNLRAAAKSIIRAEPEIARHFTEAQVEELVRILAKRLRIAGEVVRQENS